MTEDESRRGDPAAPTTALWSSALRSEAAVYAARHDAATALQLAGYGRDVADDVNVIITELTVNAFTHGGASEVRVSIAQASGETGVVITVAHDEEVDTFRVAEPPVMAEPGQRSGRGRAIVAALSDRFDTVRHPPSRIEHVVAVFARR